MNESGFRGWNNDTGSNWGHDFFDDMKREMNIKLFQTLREDNDDMEEWRCAAHLMVHLADYGVYFEDNLYAMAVDRLKCGQFCKEDNKHVYFLIHHLQDHIDNYIGVDDA